MRALELPDLDVVEPVSSDNALHDIFVRELLDSTVRARAKPLLAGKLLLVFLALYVSLHDHGDSHGPLVTHRTPETVVSACYASSLSSGSGNFISSSYKT
mmetsp:Transcript_76082/g.183983  ORF Transcript_76082/g.183983 Transcript_76082/m.183983 type:complete len:100 (+) Transcript_76082:549-848(+)